MCSGYWVIVLVCTPAAVALVLVLPFLTQPSESQAAYRFGAQSGAYCRRLSAGTSGGYTSRWSYTSTLIVPSAGLPHVLIYASSKRRS